MRRVSRGGKPPPAGLTVRNRNGTELERVRAHMLQALPAGATRTMYKFSAYKSDDVKKRLEEIFHGKCAYCESLYATLAPVDVEHYRPKGRIEGAAIHQGYWWLAAEWSNLLPSCVDCNRRRKQIVPMVSSGLTILQQGMKTGKQDAFPIAGTRAQNEVDDILAERALLLDPTRDEPDEHIAFWLEDDRASGVAYPAPRTALDVPALPLAVEDTAAVADHAESAGISVRGAVSIQVYGLNRLGLVQERAKLLQQLRFLEGVFLDVGHVSNSLLSLSAGAPPRQLVNAVNHLDRVQFRILDQMLLLAKPNAPHSAIATAYLRKFRERVSFQS